jgi:stage III sporulation protein AB
MPLKIIGSLLVLVASYIAGYSMARECSRRPSQLRDLQNMLEMFANEVRYLSNPLADAFDRISSKSGSPVAMFFKGTTAVLKEETGMNASEAWSRAVNTYSKFTALSKEDLEVLEPFGRMLGKSDVDGQMGSIELALKRLKIQERDAEEKRVKSEGMYKRLGLLLGLAIVIILF